MEARWQTGEVLDGVWRFEERHPDWEPSDDDWSPEVAWWALAASSGLVLIDPLVNDWASVDSFVNERGGVSAVLRTCYWHQRSIDEAAARYEVDVWALPAPTAPQRSFDRAIESGRPPLGGVVAYAVGRFDEIAVWYPARSALLFADVILRDEHGQASLCPAAWLAPDDGVRTVREALCTAEKPQRRTCARLARATHHRGWSRRAPSRATHMIGGDRPFQTGLHSVQYADFLATPRRRPLIAVSSGT